MPRAFGGLVLGSPAEMFVPLMAAPLLLPPANFYSDSVVTVNGLSYSPQSWLDITARLGAGVSRAQAEQMIPAIAAGPPAAGRPGRRCASFQPRKPRSLSVPRRTRRASSRCWQRLSRLCCWSGARTWRWMVLARTEERRREVAVRLAIGAPRWTVVRLFSIESLVLSIGGGLAGLLVAAWMLSAMTTFVIPGGVNLESLQLGLTARVLLFAAGAAAVTALLIGLLPALLGSRVDVLSGLKTSATNLTSGRSLARGTLVASQIAISLILIVGAGLFIRSLQIALGTEVGSMRSASRTRMCRFPPPATTRLRRLDSPTRSSVGSKRCLASRA